ncbi:MAG: dTDP-4-dehydrorhamnose reductase [Firmicutes bacterium]|nr:dTDP-4-dehydrorhamnose reductase [Bacillota bacterium]
MHILITGANGMLGHALTATLSQHHNLTGLDLPDVDITDLSALKSAVSSHRPDLIINAAAYTDVDSCETNIDLAFAVNATGPRNLAVVCSELNIPIVHISTDYIFNGTGTSPYKEGDTPNPQSVYGKSKLQGEQYIRELTNKHYIIRTSWLYGQHGKNFVDTMLRLGRERDEISVVNDQVGSPTYTVDLAGAISELIMEPAYGTYHITNSGICSWYDFTLEIFKQAGIEGVKVKPITTEELNRPAPRPRNSVLDNHMWQQMGKQPLRHYKEALKDYLQSLTKEAEK